MKNILTSLACPFGFLSSSLLSLRLNQALLASVSLFLLTFQNQTLLFFAFLALANRALNASCLRLFRLSRTAYIFRINFFIQKTRFLFLLYFRKTFRFPSLCSFQRTLDLSLLLKSMEIKRFELLTPCLQGRCSPN